MSLNLENTLEKLLQSLLEIGICASDVQESALESSINSNASNSPGGLIGKKVTQTIEHLNKLNELKSTVNNIYIPLEVINFVDQGKNPHMYTRDFVERVAGENMYTNGILSAVSDYRDLLNDQMKEAFPELTTSIPSSNVEIKSEVSSIPTSTSDSNLEDSNHINSFSDLTDYTNGTHTNDGINTNGNNKMEGILEE